MNGLVTGFQAPPWPMRPLRYSAEINSEALPETHPADADIEYVDIGAVGQGAWSSPPESLTFGAAPSRARRVVRDRDILVSTVRTYLRAVVRVEDPPLNLVASTGFAVLRPSADVVESRFLYYWCLSDHFIESVVAKSTGVSYPAINATDLLALLVASPPLNIQRRIADMLDAETARIDTLIAKNERVLGLLDLRDKSTIDQLVNSGEAVDEHGWGATTEWARVPIRSLTRSLFVDGDWIESPYITDSGVRLIQTGNIGIGRYKEQGFRYVSDETFNELRCTEVLPGDVLICRLADPVGRACVAPDLGVRMITSVDVTVVRPKPGVLAEYVALILSTEGSVSSTV